MVPIKVSFKRGDSTPAACFGVSPCSLNRWISRKNTGFPPSPMAALYSPSPQCRQQCERQKPRYGCIFAGFSKIMRRFTKTTRRQMPIYEYRCDNCGHEFDTLQKVSDEALTDCPECGKPSLVKKVSAAGFRLKGGGWYETDFKSGKKKNVAGSDSSSSSSSSDSSSSSGSSDSSSGSSSSSSS